MKFKAKSFTLVELLLVSSIMAILGLVIYQAFNNGFKLWNKAQRLNREADVSIFLDKLAEDLRCMTVISDVHFKGRQMEISFPAIILMEADPHSTRSKEGLIDQVGAVQYYFDAAQHVIYRRQANYAQAIKGKWMPHEMPVVSGVQEMDLRYQIPSEKGFAYKEGVDEIVPRAVQLELLYMDDNGEHRLRRLLPVFIGE